jgi:hypothetical protein
MVGVVDLFVAVPVEANRVPFICLMPPLSRALLLISLQEVTPAC